MTAEASLIGRLNRIHDIARRYDMSHEPPEYWLEALSSSYGVEVQYNIPVTEPPWTATRT